MNTLRKLVASLIYAIGCFVTTLTTTWMFGKHIMGLPDDKRLADFSWLDSFAVIGFAVVLFAIMLFCIFPKWEDTP